MSDYSALAQRVSTGVSGIRGCLMLSRDGMVLGAEPEGDESQLRADWVRFAALGDPERSYVEFADRIWAFVRRGGYAAFAVADPDVRPGLLVDVLEQALMVGEQERARERDTTRVPEAPRAKWKKHRTKIHKSERPPAPEPVAAPVDAAPVEIAADDAAPPPIATADGSTVAPAPVDEGAAGTDAGGRAAGEDGPGPPRDDAEVDRILLAKEFAGLLQVSREDDEASG
jgi:hypothetical protein